MLTLARFFKTIVIFDTNVLIIDSILANCVVTRCLHLNEPDRPLVRTEIPGPESQRLRKELGNFQPTRAAIRRTTRKLSRTIKTIREAFINVTDDCFSSTTCNVVLQNIASEATIELECRVSFRTLTTAPVIYVPGYNHPKFLEALRDPKNLSHLLNRPSLGLLPSKEWPERLQKSLMARKQRGGAPPTQEEMDGSIMNLEPGCSPLTIMSFKNGLHGRTMVKDWPIVDFPAVKYPMEEYVTENRKEEDRCIEQIRHTIEQYNARGQHVAGLIVEPIQAEGGDNYASAQFFVDLQKTLKETGGGATGQMWFHETWNLPSPPDIVTFSKKMLTGGFYHTEEMLPTESNRILNTWMGDPSKIVFLETIVNLMREEDLLSQVKAVGNRLLSGINKLQLNNDHLYLLLKTLDHCGCTMLKLARLYAPNGEYLYYPKGKAYVTVSMSLCRRLATCVVTRCLHQTEPDRPLVKTEIPGPESKKLLKELGSFQIASSPLGYNHPRFIQALQDPKNLSHLVNRPALGNLPSKEWPQRLQKALMSVAPQHLKYVQTMACGACSNEHAFKAVFMAYRRKQRGGATPSKEELESCLMNREPGCPSLTIMSFNNAFHGRTMGCLITTHTKWSHKLDFPSEDWPIVDFPAIRYPMDQHVAENRKEEERCIQQIRETIEQYNAKGKHVAGMIIEPIQGEGGDNYASAQFFVDLQATLKEYGTYMILDEVQTGGGATGQMWFHETWNLPSPPDIVTFSKKMLTGGFYHTEEMLATEGYRIFNTWFGDPSKIVFLETLVAVIKEQGLLEQVKTVGSHLFKGMRQLQLPALNLFSKRVASQAHTSGIHAGPNGYRTLRLRPALIFGHHHADIFLEAFEKVLQESK
ncbi:hypothetical protein LSH36_127g08000 [Paralvinella palmiformis]|uniref:4-aminobutyrate--2-oxoglutarate transaminase n=1 Tax=Paralvinella palmiformis TaxID=53620 RepID=A0AAD9JXB0_9ANNE|nr:hypothetical protein LSH36_127g08000 [Paralvinella palmiformis]